MAFFSKTHLIFFAVGVLQDLIITFYYQAVAKDWPLRSATLSIVVTLVNIFVLYAIISDVEQQVASVIVAYALGNGLGTYLVVKGHRQKWLKKG